MPGRAIAARYDAALAGSAVWLLVRRPGAAHVFHQYVIRVPDRAGGTQARLRERAIATGIHYPVPVHAQQAYTGRVALGPNACRGSEAAAAEVQPAHLFRVSLDLQVERVEQALRAVLPAA